MRHAVKVDLYAIISRAVDEGTAYGVRRAFKHTETPDIEATIECVSREVMNALCEVLRFDDVRELDE
jgi:hypothetical protein